MSTPRLALTGFVIGLLTVPVGLFVGLQVSPVIANILLSPLIGLSVLTGQPLGEWSVLLWIAGAFACGGLWALLVLAFAALTGRVTNK